MGLTQSTVIYEPAPIATTDAEVLAARKPRFARLFHSWMAYIFFVWQLLMALIGATQVFGWWQSSATVVLLSFIVITLVFYILAFWVNYGWYGATFTTRRHLGLEREECWKICQLEPTYSVVIARDLKFHSDQTHFSWVVLVYSFLLLGFGGWLIQQGTANPTPDFAVPPPFYDPVANEQHLVIRIIEFTVVAIAGACGLLLLKTDSCFLHATLVSLNSDLIAGKSGAGLRTPTEHDDKHMNDMGMPQQQGTGRSFNGRPNTNSITTRSYGV
jgi:hypothetical protein